MRIAGILRRAYDEIRLHPLFVLIGGLALTIPVAFTPSLSLYFDVTPKAVLVLGGAGCALLVWVGSPRLLHRSNLCSKMLAWLLCASAISLIVSTILSHHPEQSLFGTTWRRYGTVTQLSLYLIAWLSAMYFTAEPDRVSRLLRVFVLTGIPVAVYGIVQYFRYDPFLDPNLYTSTYLRSLIRPPSTLGHATYSAAYLCNVVFAGFGLALIDKRFWKNLGSCAGILSVAAIILSGTRSALLAVFLVGAYPLFQRRTRVHWQRMTISAVVLILLTVWFFFSRPGEQLRSRVEQWAGDASGGTRLWLWRDGLNMAAKRYIWGYGPETFETEFGRFQSAEFAKAFPNFYNESAHNIFLDALVSQGTVGLLLLLMLAGVAGYAFLEGAKHDQRLAAVLFAMFAANMITQQFMVFTIATGCYFFLNISLLVAISAHREKALAAASPSFVTRITVSIAAACLWIVAIRMVLGDYGLARVKTELEHNQVRAAISDYKAARRWKLPGASSDLWYSRALVHASGTAAPADQQLAWTEALAAARRSVGDAEDRHNAYYNLAILSALSSNGEDAEANLRLAIDWAPNWFKPHWVLARILTLRGDREAAAAEAAKGLALNGGKDPEVKESLRDLANSPAGLPIP